MKVVILAGGLGTRLAEETTVRPKPMVEIGGQPILWHIMKQYSAYGLTDFVVCCGYKGWIIKEYFAQYFFRNSDVTFDLSTNTTTIHNQRSEPWRVTLVDTGDNSETGGRLKRVADHLDGPFCLTYGDGVSDLDIGDLVAFHQRSGFEVTLTAVQPAGRFGVLDLPSGTDVVGKFEEKPAGDGTWVNGGFFVCERSVLDLIDSDQTVWERGPLRSLAAQGRLGAYRHTGFWHTMNTLQDRKLLEEAWAAGNAPWRVW
jgi:glucose-1-phosphate cytidylyltransferase